MNIISLGAGVQSSTLALMAAHGEITPMPEYAIFADTQDEPQGIYTWLDWLEKQLPFPVLRITEGSLSECATTIRVSKNGNKYTSTAIPAFITTGLATRQCTADFKIVPIRRAVQKLRQKMEVNQWIGISLDEIHRVKPSRDKWCTNRWPLIELRMKRHDCLKWMAEKGYPTPPRSAYRYCPYKSNLEWRLLRDDQPEEFEKAAKFEEKLQKIYTQTRFKGVPFLHRSLVPLRTVDFRSAEDAGQLSMFGNECEGMCGV